MDDHLPLQIPNFVYQQAPTLVPGGGAEVVPVSNAQWFVHNGFTPAAIDDSYFHSNSHQSTHHESTSSPFDFSDHTQQTQQQPEERPQQPPDFSVFLAPSPLGLPVYSQSGLDVIGLLTRVTNRPNPRIHLGPVDLSTAFCVVDTRRFDHPIVYCSETFCTLTGYSEKDVVGKNCRFLQAPGGKVAKGSVRTHTSPNAVNHLRKSLLADKECQTSIINYRKDGSVFINLVTVIPVPPLDDGEVIYQIGFQVDLNEQPNVILDKLRNGTYMVENNNTALAPPIQNQVQVYPGGRRISVQSVKDRKTHAIPPIVMSKTLRRLLGDPAFMRSIPISYPALSAPSTTTSTTTLNALLDDGSNASTMHSQNANHPLHLMLLEAAPDFIHVVSLKGDFLYVAPSVRRVLGFEAAEMQGKGLASYAHPEDVVPLMRELKEASSMGPPTFPGEGAPQNGAGNNNTHSVPTQSNISSMAGSPPHPRPVDLLFRCRTKFGRYVWVEARGRLYVEPGKGRKAIILAGRAREMTCLKWADVGRAGGVARGVREAVAANVTFGSNAAVSGASDGGYPAGVGLDGSGSEDGVGGSGIGQGPTASAGMMGTGTPDANGQVYRTRAQDAWGLLAGSCARTAVFASIGRGMHDTLGWTSEDLLGRGVLRTVVAEEGFAVKNPEGDEQGLVVRSIGEAVQGMRQAQKWLREQRRLRAAGDHQQLYQHQQAAVDLARVKKVACRLKTKAGGTLECWVVIYRADVDDDDFGSEDMNGMKHGASADGGAEDGSSSVNQQHQGHAPLRADAGASITPAPLVFQIRMIGAETVRLPAPAAASASLQALGISYGMPVWKSSPGSQAGAVPSSPSASGALTDSSPPSSSSMPTAPAAHAALTTGAGDVFAELAVARGSSWQYELQQLRITNMRLKEELAELEAAEAALGVGPSNGEGTLQAQMQQAAMVVQPQPPHAQAAQRVQAPVYAQTQPPPSQSYPSYEPVSMYQQQQDMYQYEQPQSMDLDLDYSYSGHLQQSFFAQPTPPPPPPPRRHTVSTAPGASVPSTPTQNSSNAYFHHPQPQQPLGSTLTALGDDDEASFLSGIRAALVKRQAAPTPQQQHHPTPDPRPVHKLPAPRIRPRPPQTSFNHPASEQIQQHILSSGALASSMSGHTYHQPQPHAQHQLQHQPHQMHQPQQQQQAPLPVSMPMSLSATRWPSALTGYFNNGASSGDVEDASRKRSWSAVDRTG